MMKDELIQFFPQSGGLLKHLDFLEQRLVSQEENSVRELERLPRQAPQGPTVAITELRRKQVQVGEQRALAEIQKKLIRSLKSQMTETV